MTPAEILDHTYPNGWRVVRVWEKEYLLVGARAVQVGIALRRGWDKHQNAVRIVRSERYDQSHPPVTVALRLLSIWAEDLP